MKKGETTGITCMQHWNGDICISIDMLTTGSDIDFDEIVHLSAVVLDANFKPVDGLMPFDLSIRPTFDFSTCENRKKLDYTRVMEQGMEMSMASDYFCDWLEGLPIHAGRNSSRRRHIIPLSYDYGAIRPFLEKWITRDLYTHFISDDVRDLRQTALYLNDRAAMHAEKVPYSKSERRWITNVEKVPKVGGLNAKTPLQHCLRTAAAYASICLHNNLM